MRALDPSDARDEIHESAGERLYGNKIDGALPLGVMKIKIT